MSLVAAFALTVLLAPQPKTKPTPVPPPPPGTMKAKKLELLKTEVIAEVEKNKDMVQQMVDLEQLGIKYPTVRTTPPAAKGAGAPSTEGSK